jgi:hypothetical protein
MAFRLFCLSELSNYVFSLQHFISWYHEKLCGENSTPWYDLLRLFAPNEKVGNGPGGNHPRTLTL